MEKERIENLENRLRDVSMIVDSNTANISRAYKMLANSGGGGHDGEDALLSRDLPENYVNNRVTKIGSYGLGGANITSFTGNNVARIESNAFFGCGAKEIHIPNLVESINQSMTNAHLEKFSAPLLTVVSNGMFSYCSAITEVNFPVVDVIRNNAFENCVMLETVNVQNCESVMQYAFSGCSLLKNIDFHVLKEIGQYSFRNCTNFEKLVIRKNEVCNLRSATAFAGTKIESGTGYIYVPSALVDQYKTATNWSTYADQIRAIEDYPEIVGG